MSIDGAELGVFAETFVDDMEVECRMPASLHDAVVRSGAFRQLVPEELGGRGRTPLQWFRHGVDLARHSPSTAWVVTQGAAELGWIAAGADTAWAEEVLSDPMAASASTIAGAGSLRVHGDTGTISGSWSFNSGCHGATWVGGLAVVLDEGAATSEPRLRMCWVPAERSEIVEDWDTVGLRGTGSHRTLIGEQEIPLTWTVDVFSPTANDRGPYRCLVGNGNWPIAGSVAATQLGTARRALDEALQLVHTSMPAPTFTPLAANAAVQREITDLEGLWMAAVASVERELEAMWGEACAQHELSPTCRARLATAHVVANTIAVDVVDRLCAVTGTAAARRTSVLGRCLRDVRTLEGHISVGGTARERAAQVLLGLIETDTLV